jgi:hypothetical protein
MIPITIYKHPQFKRWSSIVQRCSNPDCREYPKVGGLGITLVKEWHWTNPKGLTNFGRWIEKQLEIQPEFKGKSFCVTRINKKRNYGPSNCKLVTVQAIVQAQVNKKLTLDKVIEMRDYARANPTMILADLAERFSFDCVINLSRALRGVTWKNANEKSAPITKKLNQYRFATDEVIQ